jgi:hypothetical protein
MVCYARPAIRMGALVLVVLVILGRAGAHVLPGHFLGTAALLAGITVAAGGAAVAAALTFAWVRTVRRRRAVAGGCVHCQFRCQQAMTEPGRHRPGIGVGQPAPAAPRWPDRPVYRAANTGPRPVPVPRAAADDRTGLTGRIVPAGSGAVPAADRVVPAAEPRERAGTPS